MLGQSDELSACLWPHWCRSIRWASTHFRSTDMHDEAGDSTGPYYVPTDPMDDLQCESCQ